MQSLLSDLINSEIKVYDKLSCKYRQYLWNLRMLDIEGLWKYKNGLKNVKIAIIDSGIDIKHEAFRGCKNKGYNFINNNYDINDEFGHGTFMNGILISNDKYADICGIANKIDLYNLKVIDKHGKGNIKNIINALRWAIDNHIDIINMSIGHTNLYNNGDLEEFCLIEKEKELIDEAIRKGIIIVAAIGNSKNCEMQKPACYENVISVGSYGVKQEESLEFYISENNSLHKCDTIFAPGEWVISTKNYNTYGYDSGSSVAAIHVTGVIAYIKAIFPKINSYEIKHLILKNCSILEFENDLFKIINVKKILQDIEKIIFKKW